MNPLLQNHGQIQNKKNFSLGDVIKFVNGYKGNAQQEVQKLLQSGQMTQRECETYKQQAQLLLGNIRF